MTMPNLSNCPHQGKGWCLQCVGRLHDRVAELEGALRSIQSNRYAQRYAEDLISDFYKIADDALAGGKETK